MPTILKIGYSHYLVRKDSDAAAVVKAMAGAVKLKHDFTVEHRDRFWPDPDQNTEAGIMNVRASQIFTREPGEEMTVHIEPAKKSLRGSRQLLLENGGQ